MNHVPLGSRRKHDSGHGVPKHKELFPVKNMLTVENQPLMWFNIEWAADI